MNSNPVADCIPYGATLLPNFKNMIRYFGGRRGWVTNYETVFELSGYWILDASQTDPPSDLPNRQFGERA